MIKVSPSTGSQRIHANADRSNTKAYCLLYSRLLFEKFETAK